jgi:hypothetical protein
MNIAEKLSQIAENEQRVYNAGYEKGKSEGGELTPSEGLAFMETYDPNVVINAATYGVMGKGSCTDSVIVVPCAEPSSGRPVVCVGALDTVYQSVIGFDCSGISELHLPDTVTYLLSLTGGNYPDDTYADLRLIKFGRYLKYINYGIYHWGYPHDLVFDFSELKTQVPPYLPDSAALIGVVEIRVPMAMVDKFKTATNWSVAADRIIGV